MTDPLRPARTSMIRSWERRAYLDGSLTHLLIALAYSFALSASCGCAAKPERTADAWQPPIGYVVVDRFDLIRDAVDEEALYTLAGGLKPMSSGFWQGSFDLEDPDLTELRDVRQALGALRTDVWYADVQVFDNDDDGERWAQGFVVHRESLACMIERLESFWSPWGITPCTHPTEIVAIVDRMPRCDRWRGYGYLYGYPDHAVDFFVEAGMAAEDGREVGPGKDREFVQIPTYAADSGRFTYAVPLGHVQTDSDRALAEQAVRILNAYEQHRVRLHDVDDVIEVLLQLNDRFESRVVVD